MPGFPVDTLLLRNVAWKGVDCSSQVLLVFELDEALNMPGPRFFWA